ncbi:alpha-mannosidase, partial [Colletotrichum sojae]
WALTGRRPVGVGESFGPSWSTHWFKVDIAIPEEMRQMEHLELHWDCSNEATVWSARGEPLQGLTGRGERVEWIIPDSFRDGNSHAIFAEIVAVDLQARKLHTDIQVIHQAAQEFPEDSWEQDEALNIATRIINTFKVGDRESIAQGRKIAEEYLGPDVNSDAVFAACGDREPDEGYPYAFERVKAKVKEGQFLPIGGCWIEHDTNMPSGESLVRQFLFGQRFFESYFGFRSTTCWLPDTFGQSSQIP